MPITTFEESTIADSFGPGFPFGYRNGNFVFDLEIDNLNRDGTQDFGIVRSSTGYNFHPGIVPFANGTNPATNTSTIRLTSGSIFVPTFEVVSIKLDTL